MSEPISQQPRIVINGHVLTPEQIGTVVAGLNAIGRIADSLDEAAAAGAATDLRDAKIKQHRPRVNELRSFILGDAPAASSEPATVGRVRITVEVDTNRQDAFTRLWQEFVMGESAQEPAIRQRASDRAQGIASLRELVEVAQRDSGQCRYIARFLAGVYNGPRFPFDLTDLRAIDDALFEHAMAVLRMDHTPQKEVHNYFVDGSELWEERIIKGWDLDKETALHSAYLLAGFIEGSGDAELRNLAQRINAWRERNRRDL